MPGRFARLLIALAVLFVTTTVVAEFRHTREAEHIVGWINTLEPLAYGGVLLMAVLSVANHRGLRWTAGGLAAAAVLTGVVATYNRSLSWRLAQDATTLVFLIFIVSLLVRHLFTCREVDFDTLACSVCVYLTLGVLYLTAFSLVVDLDDDAFRFAADPLATGTVGEEDRQMAISSRQSAHGLYFSFVTLTTLGYGDITPLSPTARLLTASEAVIGQLFLTVLVARLVGLHLSTTLGRRDTDALDQGSGDSPCDEPRSNDAPADSCDENTSNPATGDDASGEADDVANDVANRATGQTSSPPEPAAV